MREYFLDILNNLDKLAGLKQLDKIYAACGDDKGAAITEVNKLINGLVRASTMFPFIPEADQQKIIDHAVISEEFPSLNANVVYHWLNKHKDRYFKESHHVESPQPAAEPLTGEARQAKIQEWLKILGQMQNSMVTTGKMSPQEFKEKGKEWDSVEIERKAVSTTIDPERKLYTEETLKERNARIREMQEKAFRERNPGASEEQVKLFLEDAKKFEVKVPESRR